MFDIDGSIIPGGRLPHFSILAPRLTSDASGDLHHVGDMDERAIRRAALITLRRAMLRKLDPDARSAAADLGDPGMSPDRTRLCHLPTPAGFGYHTASVESSPFGPNDSVRNYCQSAWSARNPLAVVPLKSRLLTSGSSLSNDEGAPARGGVAAPGQAAASIWPASVATEHEKSSRHERAGRSLRVFERRGERRPVLSLRCLSNDEVIRLGRNDTSR